MYLVVPPKFAFENGLIENLQVVMLIGFTIFNLKWSTESIVMVAAVLVSQIGEHGYFVGKLQGFFLEEFNELLIYVACLKICMYYREFFSEAR